MHHRLYMSLLASTALGWVGAAGAHHSFTASYLMDESVTIEGELVTFLFRNPHAYVHVAVTEPDGEIVRWALEWGGVAAIARDGVERDSLKPGDHVIATGEPSRKAGEPRMRLREITRPADGWTWSGDFD